MALKTEPFWWEAIDRKGLSQSEFADEYDVVVVGAGLTGSSAARTLAKNGASVLVLDAQDVAFGASTRNGGMIGEGHRVPLATLQKKYGEETGLAILKEIYTEPLAFAKNMIEEENLDCDFHTFGRFRGQWNQAQYDETARSLDDLRKIAPLNLEMIPREKQRDEVGTDFYTGGLLLHDHGGLHPGKYTAAIIQAAQRAGASAQGNTGATFCGNTRVTGVSQSGSGFEVTTDKGQVRAGAVLMATNGYTTSDFSWLKRRIFPPIVYMAVTEELPPETIEAIMPGKRMCVETRIRHCYYRLSPDRKRLMLGARASLTAIPHETAAKILKGLMVEIFPQLKDVEITHCWNGQTGFSFSFMAHLGQHDGVWHALGYSGSGNGMAPYLGHKAALNILSLPGAETNFTKTTLESKFWYQGWPWFLPIAQKLYRLQDFKENLTRGK